MSSSQQELDPHFIKCMGYLHASKNLRKGDNVPLQYMLEEAMFQKSGAVKDFSDFFQSVLPQREPEEITMSGQALLVPFEDSKGSNSDNELELDLLKEDLMCIVCNGMDVTAKNRLIECAGCHSLYHQECHNPVVFDDESFENWACSNCKETTVKVIPVVPEKKEAPVVVSSSSTKSSSGSSSKHSSSSHHRHSSSYKSSSSSSKSSDKYKSSSSKSSSSPSHSSSKGSSSSSSSSRSNVQPNINIISADKRIQNMKRKAATKLQEKRKQPRS